MWYDLRRLRIQQATGPGVDVSRPLCARDRVTITLRLTENPVDAPNAKFSGLFLGGGGVTAG